MPRILIIDDDPVMRTSARHVLERAGYDVLEAIEGEAGMRLLRTESVDLVLTDIYMPGEDGFAVLRRLRLEWPGLKVITMSGGPSTGPADLNAVAATLGAARTLTKPFNRSQLLEAVRSVLAPDLTP